MNEYDTELVQSILTDAGYAFTEHEEEADVVLVNTCSVRDSAVRKAHGYIHALRHRRANPSLIVGVLGCIATDAGDTLLGDRGLNIDIVAGPDSYRRLPSLIEQAAAGKMKISDITLSPDETYAGLTPHRNDSANAWIAIARGCDNFCSFCIVPYVRGRERSRQAGDILAEARQAASQGFKQVTLLGQNVNSYRDGACDFPALLEKVSGVDGIARIRFMSPHPKDFPSRLLDVIADNPKVCKHIHLPLQAGSDRILAMMNRGYTRAQFLGLVAAIRARCPQATLTTDVIVGFPTESMKDFEETVSLMQTVKFDAAFIFKYSARPQTEAARTYSDDIYAPEKTRRIVRLNEIQKEISLAKNRAHIGKVHTILIEELSGAQSADYCHGRTDGNKIVIIPGAGYTIGQFVDVRIDDATPHALKGKVINGIQVTNVTDVTHQG